MTWYGQPMRWFQINLVQDDALSADVESWRRLWKASDVDGLTVSAGGAIAYYPSALPGHPWSRFLGERDLFGEFCRAAKEDGLRVLARIEPSFAQEALLEAHPTWFRRDAEGNPTTMRDLMQALGAWTSDVGQERDAPLMGGLAVPEGTFMPCWNSGYYRELIPEIFSEVAQRYDVDGFFANGWPHPVAAGLPPTVASCCYCESCVAGWEAFSGGQPYPELDDVDDPRWQEHVRFVQESVEEVHRLWQRHVKAISSDLTFTGCFSASMASSLRWDTFGPVDLYTHDSQGRGTTGPKGTGPAGNALWLAGRATACMRGITGDQQPFQIVGAWHVRSVSTPSYRRVGRGPQELASHLALAVAHDARPWVNVGGGVTYDRRTLPVVEDFFSWHADAESHLRSRTSKARVAVLWSPRSAWDPQRSGPLPIDAVNGWYLALMRDRMPFDLVMDQGVTAERLRAYDVVVVPSGTSVEAEAARALDEVARAGGTGIVTGCDVQHPQAWELPSFGGDLEGPLGPSYLDVEGASAHPLARDLGDMDFLPGGRWWNTGEAPPGEGTGRLLPAMPFFADYAWVDDERQSGPLLVTSGRSVALGTDLDALFGATQVLDAGTVLASAVRHACGERGAPVHVDGGGLLEVTVWENDVSTTVHLVNLSSPDLYGGPVADLPRLGTQRVQVEVPEAQEVSSVRLLVSGCEVPWTREGAVVQLDVPEVGTHEVIAVERSGVR